MPRPAERRPRLSAGETASPRGEAFFDEFEASAGMLLFLPPRDRILTWREAEVKP